MQSVERRSLFKLDMVLLLFLALLASARYYQPYPMDDGAFFLRYADHIANGYGYHWNVGESGPIGASALFWPPLIATIMLIGIPAQVAGIIAALACLAGAYFLAFSVCLRLWGHGAAVICLLCLSASSMLLGPGMGLLETPLTVLLLAAAFYAIIREPINELWVAVIAALLLIHKIDMAPWSIGLLVAVRFNPFDKKFHKPILVGLAILLMACLAIKLSVGHLVPVSIIKKFTDSSKLNHLNVSTVERIWFFKTIAIDTYRIPIDIMFVLSLPVLAFRHRRLFIFFLIGFGGQLLAYTFFPPTEPFCWYVSPVTFAMAIVASAFATDVSTASWRRYISVVTGIVLGGIALVTAEPSRKWITENSIYTEADRSRAGQWVATHTPPSFRVSTGYGNPAFYSHRYVYDFSGLNMGGGDELQSYY